MKIYSKLRELVGVTGVSGREENIRARLSELVAPFADEVRSDSMGNLIALRRARVSGDEKGGALLLCAHMDEICFLVTFIEESGYIRVAAVGGINPVAAAYSNVVSNNGTAGLVSVSDSKKKGDI